MVVVLFFPLTSSSTFSSILSNGGGGGPLVGYFGLGGAIYVGIGPLPRPFGGPLIGSIFTLISASLFFGLFNDDSVCIGSSRRS